MRSSLPVNGAPWIWTLTMHKPVALKLVRPIMGLGGILAIAGAGMIRGFIATPNPPLFGGIALATGIAFLLFGLLAGAAWRAVEKANKQHDTGTEL